MKKLLFLFLVLISIRSSAQKIYGIVLNDKGDLLPYSSVTLKGTTIGASANVNAKFSISVSPGVYIVVCQHIGFASQEKKIAVAVNEDVEISFVLSEQKLTMKTVIVKSNGEDPAYEIIRQAIKKRPYYNKQVKAFQCSLYSKDMIKLRNLPNKILGQKIKDDDKEQMGVDSTGKGIIYLAESISTISMQQPDKFKQEVSSSRISGSNGFGFTFPAFISFYDNNVNVFDKKLNPRGFVSPIAEGALGFYKYKFLGSFWEDGKEINSIRVIPRRSYEPLFSGVINITEGDWRIHSVDLLLTSTSQLQILDTLQVTQFHVPANDDVWRVKNQVLHFALDELGIDIVGNFVNVYSSYKLDPVFQKKFFDNVVIKYDTGVNKRPTIFWDSVRPVPLEREEALDYEVKDSLYEIHKDAALTKADIDSLKKKQGALKLYKVIWGSIDRKHYSLNNTYDWGIESLLGHLEYNPAEGAVVNVNGYLNKQLKASESELSIQPHLRYGFSNTHVNAWLGIDLKTRNFETGKKLKRESWSIAGGKRISQFNEENPVSSFNNSVSSLFWGDDYMKTYENYFGKLSYSRRFESGLRLSINALYEDRIPLNNTTNFTIIRKDSSSITPNYPYQRISAQFQRHHAFIINADISFKPGQKYIEFPDSKVPLGSKYPTFELNYSKGFKDIFGSDVDFDKWEFTIKDDINLKLAGLFKYRFGAGGFINSKAVFIQDYKHFNANRSIIASDYMISYQLARYYANSTTNDFYSFENIEHHFNGLLTNKVPLLKKWDWNLVAGSNGFYVDKTNNYIEAFVGLENILKLFRVDFIVAYENGQQTITGFCIGTGGIFGDHINLGTLGESTVTHF